jgi:hypothetical protein
MFARKFATAYVRRFARRFRGLRPYLVHPFVSGLQAIDGRTGISLYHGYGLVAQNVFERVQFPAGHHPLLGRVRFSKVFSLNTLSEKLLGTGYTRLHIDF